ncbi:MAG: dTDP-4-dehydrorhamnose reductase [Actinobacteria bacterium]|nr:dTDP-4-dehydrorhamnose reductase [Actinomycetota bacterium]
MSTPATNGTTRVLVTGAGGQVGAATVVAFGANGRREVRGATHAQLDIADRDQVEQVVAELVPDAIVNCAAMTDVDRCEREPDVAFAINATGARHLAVAARRAGAHLVHVSTDYVFDGTAGRPYDEWDAVRPISEYGRSKLGGELEVARHAGSWTIARTAWVFGRSGHDFVQLVLDAAADRDRGIRFVDDQTGSPTYAPDLAAMLVRLAVERREGIFHVANAGRCTRYELARDVLELAGLDPSIAQPTTTDVLNRPAPRPRFTALDQVALRHCGLPTLRHYREALAAYLSRAGAAI